MRPPAAAVPGKRQDVAPRIRQVASDQHDRAVCSGRRQLPAAQPRRNAGRRRRGEWKVARGSIDQLAFAVPDGVVRCRRGSDAVHLSIFAGKDEIEIAGRRRPQPLHEAGGAGLEALVDVGHERAPEQVAEGGCERRDHDRENEGVPDQEPRPQRAKHR